MSRSVCGQDEPRMHNGNKQQSRGVGGGGQGASRGDLMTSSSSKPKEINAKPDVLREGYVMNNTYQGL